MARRRYVFDEQRVQKFIAQGRGQGQGPTYKPWLQIQDVPSLGRSHRPYGIKTRRVHHFLSDGEWKSFLKFEADPSVVDIREQFPMDRLQTLRAAMKLGYKHPITLDGTPYVMTVDFLITRRVEGKYWIEPYTFKYAPATLSKRESELIQIAEAFWKANGFQLRVIDENFFDEALVLNYDSVRTYFEISNLAFFRHTNVLLVAQAIRDRIVQRRPEDLESACTDIALSHASDPQIVFSIAMHLIARGGILVDYSRPLGLERRLLSDFELAQNSEEPLQ